MILLTFVKNIDFNDKLKNLNKNVTSHETKHFLVENDLNYKLLIQVFLLVKVTLIMTDYNFT